MPAPEDLKDPSAHETWHETLDAGLEQYQVKIALQDEFQRLADKYGSGQGGASE